MRLSSLPIEGAARVGSIPQGGLHGPSYEGKGEVFEQMLAGGFTAEQLVKIEQQWGLYFFHWSLVSAVAGKLTTGVQTLFSNQV